MSNDSAEKNFTRRSLATQILCNWEPWRHRHVHETYPESFSLGYFWFLLSGKLAR